MITPADRVRGFQVALRLAIERLSDDPKAEHLQNAKRILTIELERAQALSRPTSLKQVADAAGLTYEAMRVRLHTRCPEAKVGARIRLTPEIAARLLAD